MVTRFFMVEPGVLVAEQDNGPVRFDDCAARPPVRTAPSVADLAIGLWTELQRTRELRQQLAERTAEPTAQPMNFVELVDGLVRVGGLSYGDAARRASEMRPDLYNEHRAAAMLSDQPRGML
jgi:hypothetical protein